MDKNELKNEAFDLADKITDEIQKVEQEKLKAVFWRYLTKKAVLGKFEDIQRRDFPNRKNYWEYWFQPKGAVGYFLMNRELIITVGNEQPDIQLVINYNTELVFDNEL